MTITPEMHHIGTVGGTDGSLSITFVPEHGSIYLRASVPSDKRRSEIAIPGLGIQAFRNILNRMEEIQAEHKRRELARNAPQATSLGKMFNVFGMAVTVSDALIEDVNRLIEEGRSSALSSILSKEFKALGQEGVNELARLLYFPLRPRV
jgi:hypothetical protein